jgi:hypothetical protein
LFAALPILDHPDIEVVNIFEKFSFSKSVSSSQPK